MKTLFITLFMVAGATTVHALEVYPVPVRGLYSPTTESAAMLDARLARPGPPPASARVRELLWTIRGGLQLSRMVGGSPYREYLHFSLDELRDYAGFTPDDQRAWTTLAVRLVQDRQINEAYKALARARAINPADTRSAELFSALLVLDGQIERATRENRRLLDSMPDNPTIRFNLACALSLHGEAEEALHHLNMLAVTGWEELIYNLYDLDLEPLVSRPEFVRLLDQVMERQRRQLRAATPPPPARLL